MAKPVYTHDVPPKYETDLTGYIGSTARLYRGKTYRVSWDAGQPAKFTRSGEPITFDAGRAPAFMLDLLAASYRFFLQSGSIGAKL